MTGPGGGSAASSAGAGTGLRRRVYLLMAIGIFFPLVVISVVGRYWLGDLDERLQGARVAAAESVAAHLDEELVGDLELLQRLAARIGSRLEAADPVLLQQVVREAFGQFRHREAIYLLDAGRRVVAEEPHGRVSAAPHGAIPLVEEVLASGLPRLSGLQLDERGPLVHELVPVRDLAGAVVGVAGGTFNPGRRDFQKMLRHLRRGQTGRASARRERGHRGLVRAETGRPEERVQPQHGQAGEGQNQPVVPLRRLPRAARPPDRDAGGDGLHAAGQLAVGAGDPAGRRRGLAHRRGAALVRAVRHGAGPGGALGHLRLGRGAQRDPAGGGAHRRGRADRLRPARLATSRTSGRTRSASSGRRSTGCGSHSSRWWPGWSATTRSSRGGSRSGPATSTRPTRRCGSGSWRAASCCAR